MFSKFNGGVLNTIPNETIDLLSVASLVKNNPEQEKILEIRALRANNFFDSKGKGLYKNKKKETTNISVNAVLRERSLKDPDKFASNFLFPSGYIFFDIDTKDITKTPELKIDFIEKYGDKVSFVCYSCSMGGISAFIKYTGVSFSNENEYETVRSYIINTHFPEFKSKIDANTEGIGQIWFISYDPSPYENYSNVIVLPSDLLSKKVGNNKAGEVISIKDKKCKTQCNSEGGDNNTLDFTSLPSIKEVMSKMNWSTEVFVENEIVDLKEIEFNKLFIPRLISDGSKRKVFTSIFINFVRVNPLLPIEYAVSFLRHTNYNYTDNDGMSFDKFRLFINGLLKSYSEGKLNFKSKLKSIHFKKDIELDRITKMKLANKLNGSLKINKSILRIINAKKELTETNQVITKSAVKKISGLSRPTVLKHWEASLIPIQDLLDDINKIE